MSSQPDAQTEADPAFVSELGSLIVATLDLDMDPASIDPAAPLYGDGMGLDSIDILEIALAVSKRYGVQLRADDANNQRIYSSLQHLANHVQTLRTA
jgi:acyl carrier protein